MKIKPKIKKPTQRKFVNDNYGEVYSVKWVELSMADRLKMYAESVWDSLKFFPGKKYPNISCKNKVGVPRLACQNNCTAPN